MGLRKVVFCCFFYEQYLENKQNSDGNTILAVGWGGVGLGGTGMGTGRYGVTNGQINSAKHGKTERGVWR